MDGGQRPPGLTPRERVSPAQERLDRAGGHLGPDGAAESVEDRLWRLAGGRRDPQPVPANDGPLVSDEPGAIDTLLAMLPGAEVVSDWTRWDRHDKRTGEMVTGWRDLLSGEWRAALP